MKNKQHIFELANTLLKGVDLEFFQRVWSCDFHVYTTRLKALEFYGNSKVLDAGCGFGQWSLGLAELNREVHSIDINAIRIRMLEEIIKDFAGKNIIPKLASLEETGYAEAVFDAIFCYSCIYFTDYRKSIREFYRILKPGGKVYICSNGLGWYLHNLINGHNSSKYFNSRQEAIDAIQNTFDFFENPSIKKDGQLIISSERMRVAMEMAGFCGMQIGGEGTIRLDGSVSTESFYPSKHFNTEGVYEILAWKK